MPLETGVARGSGGPGSAALSDYTRRFLLSLEFLALIRVVDYRRVVGPGPADSFAATNINDPELLHLHPPHSHFSGAARGGNFAANFRIPSSDMTAYRWDVNYDHNGFRNDLDLKNADIILIGDSFVESITTPTAQLTTSLLANLQGKVVANLGQYGYGPLEEVAALRRYGLPLHPHTVVWMFFEGNDLLDVIHYRKVTAAPPKPPRSGSSFGDRSFMMNALLQLRLQFRRAFKPSGFLDRSFTVNALLQLRLQFRRAFKPSGVKRSGVIRTSNGKELTIYFLYSSPLLTKENLSALDQTTATLAAAHDLCAAQGARLILVFIPTKFRLFHSLCQFPHESECRNWALNDLPERLQRATRSISSDIGYLDLTPDLVNAVKAGVLPYYVDDDHWSPEGHQIAAEAINHYLSGSVHK